RDEAMLAVKGGSEKAKERDLIKAKLEDHLVASGRARGSGTEAERAEKENTLANEVTERIELSANATYVSEDVADVVLASYDLPTVPLTAPVRTTFAARRPNNVALQPAWDNAKKIYDTQLAAYRRDEKVRRVMIAAAPLKVAAESRLATFKSTKSTEYEGL